MEFTKDERELMLNMIDTYWDYMKSKNFVNHRQIRVSKRIVKKLNLPVVSNSEERTAVCDHDWRRIGGMDRENYRCKKCGAIV